MIGTAMLGRARLFGPRRAGVFGLLSLALGGFTAATFGCAGESSSRDQAGHAGHDSGVIAAGAGGHAPMTGAAAASGDQAADSNAGHAVAGANAMQSAAGNTASGAGRSGTAGDDAGGRSATRGNGGARASTAGGTADLAGSAGEPSETGGEAAAGAAGAPECHDLCTAGAPACCTTELHCASRPTRCRIDVLDGRLELSYTYDDLEQRIAMLPGDVLWSIADSDIASAAAEPPPAARFEFDLTPAATIAYGETLASASALGKAFRVICDDELLFDGVVYYEDGQAALDTPVMHAKQAAKDRTVLELGAWEGAWTMAEQFGGSDEARARIDRPELRADFCERGILGVLDSE